MNKKELDERINNLNFYFSDPDELGEDAFKPLDENKVNELKQLLKDVLQEAKPKDTRKALQATNGLTAFQSAIDEMESDITRMGL